MVGYPLGRSGAPFTTGGVFGAFRVNGPSVRLVKRRNPMSKPTTHERGRDARTGRIIPVSVALRRPATTVVETYKVGKKGPRN